jgi:exonuclease SbcC
MKLTSLTLKNFRKFKNATIEFPDGVTGVIGLNGAGKSTIFEAIAWVLYGSVVARTSVNEIKRQGADSSEPCRAELEFSFEEDKFRVVREMKGKSLTSSATATVNGKVAATSADTVSKFMQKKLGMDFKSFFTSIYAKQKELNALSTMIASERRPLILRMLGIDSLDDVIKEIKSDKRQKESVVSKLESDLIDENGIDKIDIYNKDIKDLKKEKDESQSKLKKLHEKQKFFKNEVEKANKNCEKIKQDYEKLQNKKEELSKQKTLFENKEKLSNEIKELSKKIDEREKQIFAQKKKLEDFKELEKELKSTDKRIYDLDFKIKEVIKKIEQDSTLIKRINQDIEEIEDKKEKIKKIGPDAKCPTCERILSDQYKYLIENFTKEINKKYKEVNKLKREIKNFESEKEKISKENSALQKKKNFLQSQVLLKEKIQTTINNILTELKTEKSKISLKKKDSKKLESIKFNIQEFEKTNLQVKEIYNKYQESLKLRDSKKDELNKLNLEIEKKENLKKLILQKIDNLNEKINELKKSKNKIKEEKILSQHLGMLSEVMSNFRTHLISRIRPTLSDYASDFFERLTDGKYHQLELDENYNLLIYDNGEPYGVERFSGGEEDLANLCLRLAISEVITERAGGVFNFIILDEIFGSQDYIRRHNIMKALNLLSSKFRQIFLVTHVDDVKEDMENIIFITETSEGNSKIKIN